MNRFGNYPYPIMHNNLHPGMFTLDSEFLIIPLIISFVVFIDLVLLGIWLWKQIKKK